ncbi:radical SAM/SPASM domain-containing protein [Peredibacter starrii]|uniref:Radical SAM/SPASM domain-containing protein n=1 Tax=Peredibacter starrii TaxID=28202 RepID=A0AAX4HRQ2_9BACT|nr:radical SAM/SPASM domain-containing protein [Peredibacter starrii]WPU66021.1 radical SAM/SPASM domain-containing protein [Peredibacter starrii]
MRFLRTYIEISNICNLQCTFCPEVERDKKILSTDDFRKVLKQVLPYTEQICLHLMGEPLAHPEFPKILKICEEEGAVIHLTTNGTFLSKYGFDTFLKSKAIRQINFSLHSFKDNFPGQDMRPYLYDILQFSKDALTEKPELYINYRLWNLIQTTEMKNENQDIIDHVCEFFQVPVNERIDVGFKKSKNITGRLYFHFDSRFEWPNYADPDRGDKGFCHALSQQIGIHADGTVVPCCLDKEAGIPLGNVLKDSFESILGSERLTKMRDGFKKQLLTEELCRKCTYIKRFDKKPRPDAAPI